VSALRQGTGIAAKEATRIAKKERGKNLKKRAETRRGPLADHLDTSDLMLYFFVIFFALFVPFLRLFLLFRDLCVLSRLWRHHVRRCSHF